MEYFKPVFSLKKKTDIGKNYSKVGEITGDQHLGDGVKCYPCFKCEHYKPECMGVRKCKFSVKTNGTSINSQEIIDKKFKELKEAKNRARTNSAPTGTQLMIESEIIQSESSSTDILPAFEEVIQDEASHDRYAAWEWQFSQLGSITLNTAVDQTNKEIVCDLTKLDHHICNQFKLGKKGYDTERKEKQWQILLDNQSISNVIINPKLVKNIRISKWALRLRTQSGECRIVMIADMLGIGTVWFYPEGVANILSQFSMAACSKWAIDYSTKRFYKTGDYKDLAFFVTTNEGRK